MKKLDDLHLLIEEVTSYTPRTVTGSGGGGGGKGGSSASSAPDTLFSTATVRLVDLLAEGEVVGVRGGLKGVYLNDIPVQNADGTFNFKGFTAEFRNGTPEQSYMAGYPDVQTVQNVGVKVNQPTPVSASISDVSADRARVTIQIPALFLSKSDGTVSNNSVSYRILARYSGGPWVNALGDITISGKTTSGYFRSHEIPLPRNPNGASAPWTVQVVRISPDTDDFNNSQSKFTNQSDIVFYSLSMLVDAKFSYPNSAVVGITAQASSFGSSMPGRRYLLDGALMPVPSNYDPVARTYNGIWDGTLKTAFSNNPAWALNLLMSNQRFGLGDYVDVASIDKWTLYDIGRYCDQMVPDGKGGQEPRAVFNGVIEGQQEAFELLQLVAQIFRGLVYWSSGAVTASQDRPRDPVMLVNESNVIKGEFNYGSSSYRARTTVALVRWSDPDNLYKTVIEVVEDEEGIARYGYNPTRVDLLGCTSRGQANRAGKWLLFTNLKQTQFLTYKAGLDHAMIRPGDVVAVMDPSVVTLDPDKDMGGRLLAGNTVSLLHLDHSVDIGNEGGYTVSVTLPDGTVQERPITNGAGSTNTLSLGTALTAVPDPAATFIVNGPVKPRLFSVTSIFEEQRHQYAVSALQYEPGKFATVDTDAKFEPTNFSEFPNKVDAPTNLTVRESQYLDLGVAKQGLTLSWMPANVFNVTGYYVTAIRPSGAVINLPRRSSVSADFTDVEPGKWTFLVTTIGLNGKFSLPAQLDYTVVGWQGQATPSVRDLQVRGGGAVFSGRSCTVTWRNELAATVSPYVVTNVVYVYDSSTNALLHREVLPAGQVEWTYDYLVNVNESGPRRQFRIAVTGRSVTGAEGAPASLAVSNPAPEIIVPTLGSTSEVLFVDLPKVADADFAGYLIWISETPNINPLTAPSFDTTANSFPHRGVPDKTYYVRAAAYDAFGKDPAQLNVSAEQSKKLTIQLFDPSAPEIPGQPIVSANISETAPDGTVTAKVTIAWPAVTSSNLGRYEVFIAEGNNPVESAYIGGLYVTGPSATVSGLTPGNIYSFKVRAVSKQFGGVPSGLSQVLVVTAAINAVPPGEPTGFAISMSFEAANLSWLYPTRRDLLGVEVWVSGALTGPGYLATVAYPATSFRDPVGTATTRYYWIRTISTSRVPSNFVGPVAATSVALAAAQLQAGIIDATKLASSIAANTVVAALPTTKTTDYVTFQGQQYRWDTAAGGYTKAVSASDIAGKVTAAQIDKINAAQIADQVKAAQIESVAAGQITGALTSDQVASLDAAKVAGTLTAANIDFARLLGTIAGTQIAAGSIVGSKLAIVSTNMAYNADASQGTRGYVVSTNATGSPVEGPAKSPSTSQYAPNGFTPVYLRVPSSVVAGGYAQFTSQAVLSDGSAVDYPISAGTAYELSACISAHRCAGTVAIAWFDDARGYISETPAGTLVPHNVAAGGAYSAFPKSFVIGVAPNNAVSARLVFRLQNATGGNPYIFVSAVMFAATRAGAIEASPYVAAGVTSIDGSGIITRSISASRIVTESLTANEIAANAITTAKIAAGSVITSHMTAGTINADRLVAQSITAGLIAGSTITGDKIAGRTIAAGNIVAGTITGNEIQAASVNADRLVANSITTAQIAAGAIKTAQLDAGAITADKLGVGLNTGNLCWNSDQALAGWFNLAGPAGVASPAFTQYALSGTKPLTIMLPGTPASGTIALADLTVPNLDGTRTTMLPVQAGKTYEFSAYLSVHRCAGWLELYFYNAAGTSVASTASAIIPHNVWDGGPPSDAVRAKIKLAAPTTAVAATIRLVMRTTGEGSPYVFGSGFYLAIVPENIPAGVFSDYVPQSRTVINGGQIATGSLSATAISAGTITTDRMQAGQINLDTIGSANSITTRLLKADVLQAGNITVGNGTLSSLFAGTNTTRINGGAIEANTILANRLRIGARGIQVIGLSFYAERSNGALTGVLGWTFGSIIYTADDGSSAGVDIPANRAAINGGNWYVVWGKGQNTIGVTQDWSAYINQQDVVLLATVSGYTAISTLIGGTIIDGTRITTQSIQADQIAANQIQTQHMAANSIRGDRILAGSLSADRITTGSLTVGSIIQIGSGAQTEIWSDANGGGLRVRNRELSRWRGAYGYIGYWTGDPDDYGMIQWRADGAVLARFSNAVNYIAGVVIGDAEITNAKIGNLQVSNTKIADFAVSTITAAASGSRDTATNIVSRSDNSKFLVLAFFNGNSNLGSTAGPGAFTISRNGTQLTSVNASFALFKPDSGNLQYYLTSMCIGVIDQPGQGTVSYSCFHSNGQGVGGVTIVAIELAK